MNVFDWSTAEPPVWRVLGPEIAETLRHLIAEMKRLDDAAAAISEPDAVSQPLTRTYKPGRPHGKWLTQK